MIPYRERNEKFCKIIELLESLVFSNRKIKKYQYDTRRAIEFRIRNNLMDSFTENLRGIIINGNEASTITQEERKTNRHETEEEDSNRFMPLMNRH